jgi:hypothetical protein
MRALVALFVSASVVWTAEPPAARTALQPFNLLVGSWRVTGTPEGTAAERQKGFWSETHAWEWQFKGTDAWLKLVIDKGKHYTKGELRAAAEGKFTLALTTTGNETHTFTGTFADKKLTLERSGDQVPEPQRLTISLLHHNRILWKLESKPAGAADFAKRYQLGVTKEGEAFATGGTGPECIVSGGLGTMRVEYKGKTYYVCCGGCRDAFNADPESFIKEYEAKKKAKKE